MSSFILFGVGSAIVVEYVETCRRLDRKVVLGVENRETRRLLPRDIMVTSPERIDAALLGVPALVPLFTPANRAVAVEEAIAVGLDFPESLIDPTAIVAGDFFAGGGSFINAGVIVGACTTLGMHVVINRGASIGHHGRIGDFCSLGPGAILAGEVTVGHGAMIGAGAIVLPGLTIGAHAVIGAGAIVTVDVPPGTKMLGVKARAVDPVINA